MNLEKMMESFALLREREDMRECFVRQLIEFESLVDEPGFDVRERITGPMVDALYDEGQILTKTLADGTVFEFFYRSKIARDFVMSLSEKPSHVWEPQTTRLLMQLSNGVKDVVIGGAYFGDHAILIAKSISMHGGKVHAFEPNHEQRNMLLRNAKINGLANVVARGEGLWDRTGVALSLEGFDSFAHSRTVDDLDAEGSNVFHTVTVDDYLSGAEVESIGLLMLDIEGGELRVLKGAERFLRSAPGIAPNIVFEVHRHYVDWTDGLENTEIIRYLVGLGYSVFAVRDFNSNFDMTRHPVELIPADEVYLEGPPHGFNMVAVKDISIFSGEGYRFCSNVSPKLLRHKSPELHHPLGGL
jgi:FkbM family methyltransferase